MTVCDNCENPKGQIQRIDREILNKRNVTIKDTYRRVGQLCTRCRHKLKVNTFK